MNQSRELKAEYKRLKRLVKQEPSLFARLADVELTLGKTKGALRRLENGLNDYPDHAAARSIYADCLSAIGDHEASLKQWEEVIYAEPMNQKARAGYIRELAYLERPDSMSDALSELYLIDPFDGEIEERHKDSMLQSIRDRHSTVRAWHPQWHPGDFTGLGAVARAVIYSKDLMPKREPLPDGFEPSLDENAMQALLERLPMGEVGDDLEQSLGAMVEESAERDADFDEEDLAETLDTLGLDDEDIGARAVSPDQTDEAEERALSALLEDDKQDSPTSDDPVAEVETEEVPQAEEVEDEEPEEPDNPLIAALKAAEVDTEGIVDIEQIVNRLDQTEDPIVEPPDLEESVVEVEEESIEIAEEAPAEDEVPADADMEEEITQDDLDALKIESEGSEAEALDGPMTQDQLDALFQPAEPAASEPPEEEKAEAESTETAGAAMSQDQLDALFQSSAPSEPSSDSDVAETVASENEVQPRAAADVSTDEITDEESPADQLDEIEEAVDSEEIESEEAPVATNTEPEEIEEIISVEAGEEAAPVEDETADTKSISEIDQNSEAVLESTSPEDRQDEEPTERDEGADSMDTKSTSGFDIDRWFAARREKRIQEQADQGTDDLTTTDNSSDRATEMDDQEAADTSEDLVNEFVAEDEGDLETSSEDARVKETPASAAEEEIEQTAPVEPSPPPLTSQAMSTPSGRPRTPPPPKPPSKEDEIAPNEIRGPVTKTFARLYMQQGKMEHAAEIVRRLLLEMPDDKDVLDLKTEIDKRLV
ncbi:hypothetical protein KQI63_07185 [bacterium]|nr:hypothetical protein [bacterium]